MEFIAIMSLTALYHQTWQSQGNPTLKKIFTDNSAMGILHAELTNTAYLAYMLQQLGSSQTCVEFILTPKASSQR